MFLKTWLDFYGPESRFIPTSIDCSLCKGIYYYQHKYYDTFCKMCMSPKKDALDEQDKEMKKGACD